MERSDFANSFLEGKIEGHVCQIDVEKKKESRILIFYQFNEKYFKLKYFVSVLECLEQFF